MILLTTVNDAISTPIRFSKQIMDKNSQETPELVLAKVACLAQIFFSIKAVPILLVLGMITAGIDIYNKGNGEKALTETLDLLKKHLFYNIPYCFTGLCMSPSTTREVGIALEKYGIKKQSIA